MQHILLCLPLCKPNRGLLAFGRLILTFAFGGVLGCAQGDLAKSNTGGSGGTSGGGQGGLDIVDHEPTDPAFVPQRLRRPSNIEFDKSVASLLSVDDRPARSEPYFDAITDLQIDLLTQAFACDLTRFATFLMNDLSRTKIFC